MADRISTRLQRDVGQLQKDMEKMGTKLGGLESKMNGMMEQMKADIRRDLRKDMEEMYEKWGTKMERMISLTRENISAKAVTEGMDMGSPGVQLKSSGDSSGNGGQLKASCIPVIQEPESLNTTMENFKVQFQRSKVECPKFDGKDFLGWFMKVEQYFEAMGISKEDKVQTVMINLEGKALQWHQRFMKTQGSLKDVDWQLYAKEMRARFHDDEYADPMSELVTLKQTGSVEEYFEEFEAILNFLQLPDDYALSIFLSNLKVDISKSVRLFYPKNLTHALHLAKHMENIIYNLPRKPFQPYRNSPVTNMNPHQSQPITKPNLPLHHNLQPALLPTPKLPTLTYQNQSQPYNTNTNKTQYPKNDTTKNSKGPTMEEKNERRRKGLCMWCGSKYVYGHQCFKSQLYHLLVDSDEKEGELEEFADCMDFTEEGVGKEDATWEGVPQLLQRYPHFNL